MSDDRKARLDAALAKMDQAKALASDAYFVRAERLMDEAANDLRLLDFEAEVWPEPAAAVTVPPQPNRVKRILLSVAVANLFAAVWALSVYPDWRNYAGIWAMLGALFLFASMSLTD